MSQPLLVGVVPIDSSQAAESSSEAPAQLPPEQPAPQAPAQAAVDEPALPASDPLQDEPFGADDARDAADPGETARPATMPSDGERRLRGPLGRRRRGRGDRPAREGAPTEPREAEVASPLADGEDINVAAMPEQPLARELLERGRRAAQSALNAQSD